MPNAENPNEDDGFTIVQKRKRRRAQLLAESDSDSDDGHKIKTVAPPPQKSTRTNPTKTAAPQTTKGKEEKDKFSSPIIIRETKNWSLLSAKFNEKKAAYYRMDSESSQHIGNRTTR